MLSGVSQLAFQRKRFPREDGQAEITNKEVPGDNLGGDGDCSVSGFPWVFPFLSVMQSATMGSAARAAGVCVVAELLVEGLCCLGSTSHNGLWSQVQGKY